MKVAHFIPVYKPAFQYGGPVLSVSRLCESLASLGVDVSVLTTNAGITQLAGLDYPLSKTINGVTVTYFPVDRHPASFISSRFLKRQIDQYLSGHSLLHTSSVWQPVGLEVQKAAHRLNIPVIQTLRGALGPYSWNRSSLKKLLYYHLFEHRYLQRCSAIHCTTPQEQLEIQFLNLKPPKVLLPNPIDLCNPLYSPSLRSDLRSQLNIPNEKTLFLVAGRLHHKKGLDILPSVLNSLPPNLWHICFVGNDSDGTKSSLQTAFSLYSLSNNVSWFDTVSTSDLHQFYSSSDWLLLPSRHENFGNVIPEALSCGCGAVSTHHVGVAELLANCPGFYTLTRSPSDWVSTLASLLKVQRPGIDSETFVTQKFASNQIASEAISIYRQVINNDF